LQDLSRTSRKADILLLIARGTFQTMIAAWNTKLAGSEIASSLAMSPAPICVAPNQEDFQGCQGRSFPMRLRVLVLAAGLLWPVSSFSQDRVSQSFETGYQLYEDCNAALGSPQNIFCMGYVMGVSDSLDSQKLMCVPQEDSAAQEMSVIVDFLRDHPEERQDTAYGAVKLALMGAFPCK
jgi:Rap1a immunity proteins